MTPLLMARGEVELRDGRRLAYSSAGPRDGFPVLYFHGAIGSPIANSAQLEARIEESRIRYLTVERPGFGDSDPHPGRRVADFAADVEQLADSLGFPRFSVVGVSAGAPYALACAAALPGRVAAAGAVSSIPAGLPPHRTRGVALRYRLALGVLARWPERSRSAIDSALRLMRRHPELLRRVMSSGATREDRRAMDTPGEMDSAERFLVATARGSAPMIEDYGVCCRDWGFHPREVTGRVHLWHGIRDHVIPVGHIRRLAAMLPNCRASFGPEDGHFFFTRRIDEILPPLVDAQRAERDSEPPLELAA